jgi:hypothetical protein
MVDETKEAPTRHWVRWLTLFGSASLITLWVPSCLYDDSKPCGDDLKFDGDVERCVCPEGSIYSPTGCIKCGEHAIVQGAACVCDEGYAQASDGSCQEVVTGSGGSSTTGSTTGSTATTSGGGESGGGGEGGESADDGTTTETATSTTSTTGSTPECTINDDCETTEICDAGVCRPPTGWGAACTTSDDCADFEAGFCDAYQHTCTVSDCTSSPKTCPAGFDCCDLSAIPDYAIMCIPAGFCQTPAP